MKISKLAYFFWFMKDIDLKITNNKVVISDVEYEIKNRNKYIFLFLRYLPIFIFFAFTFNKYDFTFDNEKILQYAAAIVMFLSIVIYKRVGLILTVVAIIVIASLTLANYFELENMAMPFIVKYLIFIFTIYDFYRYKNYKLYEILQNNKIKTHLIILKETN